MDNNKSKNSHAFLIFIIVIVVTIVLIAYRPVPMGLIILSTLVSLVSMLVLRYSYEIARFNNKWYSLFNRKKYHKEDDEPSSLAVFGVKFGAYIFIMIHIALLFINF